MGAGLASGASRTSPTKRNPRRVTVRMSRCSAPVSPIARRAALTLLASVSSDTNRPSQTASDELIFAHDAVSMPHQMDQHVEYLWFDVDDGAFSTELTPVYLDFAVCE